MPIRSSLLALAALLLLAGAPAPASAAGTSSASRSAAAFRDVAGRPAPARAGARPDVRPQRFRGLTRDHAALGGVLAGAPRQRTAAPLVISLPAPDGRDRRFAVRKTAVMEPALAAAHPEIATYSGTGIDDPGTTVYLDLTPLGLHAAVRGPGGAWYVDPYYHGERSLYASYRGADVVENPHGSFVERELPGAGPARLGLTPRIDGAPVALRTYRLALASDPAYATFHGAANVTAAKVTLVNRVNQVYEDDLAIHLTLVAGNDLLNLDTAAQMTGANGPCGAAPCYSAAQAADCSVGTLNQTRVVLGQLIGASNYDVGHIGMGVDGGGVAYLGVVGDDLKGGGCTGVSTPVGDLFAVDYVAHEIGHQFAGSHTFNGVAGSCAGNGSTATSVEPGSGSSIMAYAGICGTDNVQPHSDPYFSQRSIDEIAGYVAAPAFAVGEVQTVSLRDFAAGDAFRLTYDGAQSAAITQGGNYTAAGIKAEIEAIVPGSATVTVGEWDGTTATPPLGDVGFSVRFNASTDFAPLTVTSPAGTTGFVGETAQGGPRRNGGTITADGNREPIVAAPAGFTIPARTPFALTGAATDADGDALTYLWEQNDSGPGKSLVSNTKPDGPLFRVFGIAAQVSPAGTLLSPSPGENAVSTSPTRVFPDLAQVVAGTTNAATGACPAAGPAPVAAAILDCYSEFLPTAAYAGALHFRLTARDGRGGVAHGDTTLALARSAGPFRVTSQAAATSVEAGAPFDVTWSIAGTDAAPVNAVNVRITLSTDGGQTFPHVVRAATTNDGAQTVILPNAGTAQARIRVAALGNVFFDVNHADFTIVPGAPVVSAAGGTIAQYTDAPGVVVSATDENSPGSALTATATGLPAGLALVPGAPSAGARSWTVGGAANTAPGTYPVEVTVDDGAGHVGIGAFDIVVTPEDATATYTGDTLLESGPATLRFAVRDSAAVTGAGDATPGDLANATVTFVEGATTLCDAVPVTTTTGDAATGSATCTADLTPGVPHRIDAIIGGRYTGTGSGDVQIAGADPLPPDPIPAGPTPPALPAALAPLALPAPPATPAAAALAPDLARVAKRLRLSRAGRAAVTVRCRTVGTGTAAATCIGTLKLTARIGGRRQTVGTARFSFPRAATRTVAIKLGPAARRALKRARAATLTATVANGPGGARTATKAVTLVPFRAA